MSANICNATQLSPPPIDQTPRCIQSQKSHIQRHRKMPDPALQSGIFGALFSGAAPAQRAQNFIEIHLSHLSPFHKDVGKYFSFSKTTSTKTEFEWNHMFLVRGGLQNQMWFKQALQTGSSAPWIWIFGGTPQIIFTNVSRSHYPIALFVLPFTLTFLVIIYVVTQMLLNWKWIIKMNILNLIVDVIWA